MRTASEISKIIDSQANPHSKSQTQLWRNKFEEYLKKEGKDFSNLTALEQSRYLQKFYLDLKQIT